MPMSFLLKEKDRLICMIDKKRSTLSIKREEERQSANLLFFFEGALPKGGR